MLWLLESTVARELEAACRSGNVPTAAQQADYEATVSAEGPRILAHAGRFARISVQGILTDRPSLMARWFGGANTTYAEIIEAIQAANSDNAIDEIELYLDSVGGMASAAWLAAMEAVRDSAKTIHAHVGGVATSAAYGLASQAETITARNDMAYVGSVGVAASFFVSENFVDVTSTNAPDKRPDVSTEEGRAAVQRELDAIHDIFVSMIAAGRNTTVKNVNQNYGRGATLVASEAITRGMIDRIATAEQPQLATTASGGNQQEAQTMDLGKLKAEYPAVYDAAVAEGKAQGVTAERERVEAFLLAGETSGDMKLATDCIKEGKDLSPKLTMQFMVSAAAKGHQQARADDDTETARAADATGHEEPEATDVQLQQVAKMVAEATGYQEAKQ